MLKLHFNLLRLLCLLPLTRKAMKDIFQWAQEGMSICIRLKVHRVSQSDYLKCHKMWKYWQLKNNWLPDEPNAIWLCMSLWRWRWSFSSLLLHSIVKFKTKPWHWTSFFWIFKQTFHWMKGSLVIMKSFRGSPTVNLKGIKMFPKPTHLFFGATQFSIFVWPQWRH